jgi:hypothetical protein
MGSKGLHTWFNVILPASLPFIVSGMKQGWAFAWRSALRPRIKCHGPGYRRHARHCRNRSASGQNCVCAVGALSPSAMGHRTSLREPELSSMGPPKPTSTSRASAMNCDRISL